MNTKTTPPHESSYFFLGFKIEYDPSDNAHWVIHRPLEGKAYRFFNQSDAEAWCFKHWKYTFKDAHINALTIAYYRAQHMINILDEEAMAAPTLKDTEALELMALEVRKVADKLDEYIKQNS